MITEQDFIDKMIEIANDGPEYMEELKCIYFAWNEFFNTKEDRNRAEEVASEIFSAVYPDGDIEEEAEFWDELFSVL